MIFLRALGYSSLAGQVQDENVEVATRYVLALMCYKTGLVFTCSGRVKSICLPGFKRFNFTRPRN